MSKPKQHHYIHESYLESFAPNGEPFWVFDKWENGRIFPGKPENVMKEAQYYSQPDYLKGQLDPKLETFFSKIEGHWPSLLQKISDRKPLALEDHFHFFETLVMLRVRVPNARKAVEACLRKSVEESSDFEIQDIPPELSSQITNTSKKLNEKLLSGSLTMKDLIEEKIIDVSIDPHRSIGLISQHIDSLSPTLRVMKYRSFLHNSTKTKFYTSDNPVLIYRQSSRDKNPDPYPWQVTTDFCICFVLSPSIAFYYNSREKSQPEHRNIRSENTVRKINKLVALFADRFVVCSTRELAENFKDTKNICPVPDFSNCQVDPEFITKLAFEFGGPIKMSKWKYDFQEGQ